LAIVVNDLDLRRTHPLYSTVLGDATFHELLLVFDQDIAIAARRERCLLCRSVVHSARYRRKPRGRPAGLGEEHDWRFSFCCTLGGCRKRKTPPSLRFLGRKVYLAAMVVLISIMREGATAAIDIVDPPVDFLALAASMGLPAHRIDRVADIAPALEAAISSGVPNLIEIPVSPA
jgi:hypothetical protein